MHEIKISPRQSLLEAGSAHPRQRLRFNRRGSRRVSLGPHIPAAILVPGADPRSTAPRPCPQVRASHGGDPAPCLGLAQGQAYDTVLANEV